jgi:serine/threonine-protein kinase
VFDTATLMVLISACSTVLVFALWVGSYGRRLTGLGTWIAGLGAQTLSGILLGFRPYLPYWLGVTAANVVLVLSGGFYSAAMAEFAGRRLPRARLYGPAAVVVALWPFLRNHFPQRVVLGNGLIAAGLLAGVPLGWRLTRAHRAPVRGLFLTGLVLMALTFTARCLTGAFAGHRLTEFRAPSGAQAASVLVYVGGSLLASIGFLVLHRERLEEALEARRAELAALNRTLEARVASQVSELVAHARDVERLNAELRQQVRTRSRELTEALARAAQGGGAALAAGDILAGRFVLESELGRGGMGVVYRARDAATGEAVALKVVEATSADELDALYRFLREASASAHVGHPAVVSARHVDVADGRLFMVFELVDGCALDKVLRREGALPAAVVALLGARVAEALAAAHAAGVVHRDLKPGNVMLAAVAPTVRLLDFGISKLRGAAAPAERATQQGAVLGTPAYMAPEQVVDSSTALEPSDVFALGAMLYEMLAGALPFEERDLYAMLFARLVRDPAPLAPRAPNAPPALVALVHRCLLREPDARPTAADLAASLADCARRLGADEAALAALARPLSPPPRAEPDLGHAVTVASGA